MNFACTNACTATSIRYDARGYLNDLSLYDSKQLSKQPNVQLTDEELELERLLNIERFADLKDDEETEEAGMLTLKRCTLIDHYHKTTFFIPANDDAVSGGQYSNVGYHYKNSDKMAERENGHVKKVEEKEKDIFKVPFGLNILPNLTLVSTLEITFITCSYNNQFFCSLKPINTTLLLNERPRSWHNRAHRWRYFLKQSNHQIPVLTFFPSILL